VNEQTVLFLSYAFPPIASSGTFRVARFGRYLPEFGWRPIVVSAKPADAIYNEVDPSLARLIPADMVVRSAPVLRPLVAVRKRIRQVFPRVSANGKLSATMSAAPSRRAERPMRDLVGTLFSTPDRHVGWILPAVTASLSLIRRHRPRVILSSGPPHSAHVAALLLKQLTGLPIVCDLRDPWARNPWETAGSSCQNRTQSLLERACVVRANAIILNTENARREFESHYAGQNCAKFTAIPNGYDPSLTPSAETIHSTPGSAPEGVVGLCHCGSVYGNRSLIPLAQAIAKLKKSGQEFELRQVGVVGEGHELSAFIREQDLENSILLKGQVPHSQALASMAAANILVVIQGGTDLQVPAKLFEMLPFRKPIIALTGPGPTAEIVRTYNLGVVADPNDPDAIAAAITRLSANCLNSSFNSGVERALRDFDGRRLTGQLARVLRSCLESPSPKSLPARCGAVPTE
jgi:glycosyltransferase involved in cell wall biosynthesis